MPKNRLNIQCFNWKQSFYFIDGWIKIIIIVIIIISVFHLNKIILFAHIQPVLNFLAALLFVDLNQFGINFISNQVPVDIFYKSHLHIPTAKYSIINIPMNFTHESSEKEKPSITSFLLCNVLVGSRIASIFMWLSL